MCVSLSFGRAYVQLGKLARSPPLAHDLLDHATLAGGHIDRENKKRHPIAVCHPARVLCAYTGLFTAGAARRGGGETLTFIWGRSGAETDGV